MGGAPSRILDDPPLFLGGADVLKDKRFFESNGITAVLSLGEEEPTLPSIAVQMKICKEDSPDADLLTHFPDAIDFIHGARSARHATFVHCHAGISRSSTCTAAYLMAHLNLSMRDALAHLVRCRDTVCPNPGFRDQLLEFERTSARALHDTLQRRLAPDMLSADLRFVASILVHSKADVDAQAASEWVFASNGKPCSLEDLATLADDHDGNGTYVIVREPEDDPRAPPARRRGVARPRELLREAAEDWREADFVPWGSIGFDAQVSRLRERLQPLVDSKQAAPGGLAGLEWLAEAASRHDDPRS